jgi:hypothetical protein
MKRLFLVPLCLYLFIIQIFGQEVKPTWAERAINPPIGANYIFVVGRGEGKDRTDAIKKAEYDAIKTSAFELGAYGITTQELQNIEKNGLDIAISTQKMPRRRITQEIIEKETKDKKGVVIDRVYICYTAYAVKRDINGKDDLYEIDLSQFEDKTFAKRNEIAARRGQDDFFVKGRDKYVGLHLLDISYPFSLSFVISGRHGGKIGFGYEASLGWSYEFNHGFATMTYAGKIRFYCYKNMFIQTGFGALGIHLSNKIEEVDYSSPYYHDAALAYCHIQYGIPIQVGCDFVGRRSFYSSFRGGCAYDIVDKSFIPSFNIGIGVKL